MAVAVTRRDAPLMSEVTVATSCDEERVTELQAIVAKLMRSKEERVSSDKALVATQRNVVREGDSQSAVEYPEACEKPFGLAEDLIEIVARLILLNANKLHSETLVAQGSQRSLQDGKDTDVVSVPVSRFEEMEADLVGAVARLICFNEGSADKAVASRSLVSSGDTQVAEACEEVPQRSFKEMEAELLGIVARLGGSTNQEETSQIRGDRSQSPPARDPFLTRLRAGIRNFLG